MTKLTTDAPHLIQLRTAFEVAGLIALALALWKVYAQRRTIQRIADRLIERGDAELRRAVNRG